MKRRHGARGAALIVVLVAMLAMAAVAFAALRSAMNSQVAAGNLFAQTEAREAAQEALRWCERELLEEAPSIAILPAPAGGRAAAWSQAVAWRGGTAAAVSVAGAASGRRPPQCLAERMTIANGSDSVVLVTARGFSRDFAEESDGSTMAGSVVWLQSIVSLSEP